MTGRGMLGGFITLAVAAGLIGALLVFPVWKQNRYNALKSQEAALAKQEEDAHLQCAILQRQVKSLQSRERLETLGKSRNMVWGEPVRIIREGRP